MTNTRKKKKESEIERTGRTRLQQIWSTNMAQLLWDREMLQKDLAKILEIHPVQLNEYLTLKKPISLHHIERFAKALKLRPESFFIARPKPKGYKPVLEIESLDPELEFFGD